MTALEDILCRAEREQRRAAAEQRTVDRATTDRARVAYGYFVMGWCC